MDICHIIIKVKSEKRVEKESKSRVVMQLLRFSFLIIHPFNFKAGCCPMLSLWRQFGSFSLWQLSTKGQLLLNPIQKLETMATSSIFFSLFLYLLAFSCIADGEQVILVNNCKESIWPGILGGAGHSTPENGGFHLGSGEEVVLDVLQKWSGRIWGRQGCNFDRNGKGFCDTGDCSGMLQCKGTGGTPPATVIEMTLGTSSSPLHFYDVSLVDGFNLPVSMKPVGGGIGCGVASCEVDLNVCCPSALEVKKGAKVVGCKSACLAMQSAKYCCTGEYANPKTCKPTLFAHLFKAICPKAYSYAFDDVSSLNKCRASRYVITFCPPK